MHVLHTGTYDFQGPQPKNPEDKFVLHLDLKPANVLLGEFSPKVIDLGLARALKDATGTGTIGGTPGYMAPEQLRGGDTDAQTDVYVLEGILFFGLTQEPPYKPFDPLPAATQQHLERPQRSPREIRPGIPNDLEAICLKCLKKEKRDRYQSAQELAGDLQCFLDGNETTARPWLWARRVQHWAQRHPKAVRAFIGIVLNLGLVSASLFHWQYKETEDQRLCANATTKFADIATAELVEVLAEERTLKFSNFAPVRKKILTTAIKILDPLVSVEEVSDRVRTRRGVALLSRGKLHEELLDREKCLEDYTKAVAQESTDSSEATTRLEAHAGCAACLFRQGQAEQANKHLAEMEKLSPSAQNRQALDLTAEARAWALSSS